MPLSRIDASVKRILKNKFDLGLFDNPYVEVDQVKSRVNTERNIKLGKEAQKQSMVLLKNDSTLPLEKNINIFVDGFNAKSIVHGNVVSDIKDADVIVSYVHTVFNGNQPSRWLIAIKNCMYIRNNYIRVFDITDHIAMNNTFCIKPIHKNINVFLKR